MEIDTSILESEGDLLKLILASNLRIIRKLDQILTKISKGEVDYQRQFLIDNLKECEHDLCAIKLQLREEEIDNCEPMY